MWEAVMKSRNVKVRIPNIEFEIPRVFWYDEF